MAKCLIITSHFTLLPKSDLGVFTSLKSQPNPRTILHQNPTAYHAAALITDRKGFITLATEVTIGARLEISVDIHKISYDYS